MGELVQLRAPTRPQPIVVLPGAAEVIWLEIVGDMTPHELLMAMALDPRVPEGSTRTMVRAWLLEHRLDVVGPMSAAFANVAIDVIVARVEEG
jgi:hypothetical protein